MAKSPIVGEDGCGFSEFYSKLFRGTKSVHFDWNKFVDINLIPQFWEFVSIVSNNMSRGKALSLDLFPDDGLCKEEMRWIIERDAGALLG